MSVRVTWQASPDPDIASYLIETALSPGGPWTTLTTVIHDLSGPNWDATGTVFFYNDLVGNESTCYRITAIDSEGLRSASSQPFQAASSLSIAIPSLVNSVDVVAGDVGILLGLGFTTVEVWSSDDDGAHWTELTANGRLELLDGLAVYTFYDVAGRDNRRYRWRFSKNGQAPISKYSQYVFGSQLPLSGAPISVATARFVGPDGRPQQRSVIIVVDESQMVAGFTIGDAHPVVVPADVTGYWQAPLVQGVKVRVAIEGSGVVKTFTVPAATTFDLLQVMADAPDVFAVQQVPPLLTRRSL